MSSVLDDCYKGLRVGVLALLLSAASCTPTPAASSPLDILPGVGEVTAEPRKPVCITTEMLLQQAIEMNASGFPVMQFSVLSKGEEMVVWFSPVMATTRHFLIVGGCVERVWEEPR